MEEGKGTQRFFLELGNYLIENGNEVKMIENSITQLKNESSVKIFNKPLFEVSQISFEKKKFFYRLPLTIPKNSADLIYVSSLNYIPFIESEDIPIMFGMHVIYPQTTQFRNFYQRVLFSIKQKLFHHFVARKWYKRKDKISFHALNKEQAVWIQQMTGNKFPVYILPNPVNCRNAESCHAKVSYSGPFKVLYFGSLSYGKGFASFLKVYDYLKDKHPDKFKLIDFVIAGDGPMRNAATSYSKQGSNFSFVSKPDDIEKKRLFCSSDLLVYPSTLDNFPYLVVEAQICGLPILAFDIPGVREIIINDKTGQLCPHTKIDGFAEKVIEYFESKTANPELYILMRNNIQEISKRFCSRKVLPEYYKIFEEFMAATKEY